SIHTQAIHTSVGPHLHASDALKGEQKFLPHRLQGIYRQGFRMMFLFTLSDLLFNQLEDVSLCVTGYFFHRFWMFFYSKMQIDAMKGSASQKQMKPKPKEHGFKIDWTIASASVAKENGCTLPLAGLFIMRYHSFYPLHKEGAYSHLMNDEDRENLKWLHIFNKYDLYSKSKVLVDVEKVKPYYQSLIEK
ncbi:hypothetical protein S83_023657, partial [Arachis hypogaea]